MVADKGFLEHGVAFSEAKTGGVDQHRKERCDISCDDRLGDPRRTEPSRYRKLPACCFTTCQVDDSGVFCHTGNLFNDPWYRRRTVPRGDHRRVDVRCQLKNHPRGGSGQCFERHNDERVNRSVGSDEQVRIKRVSTRVAQLKGAHRIFAGGIRGFAKRF